MIVRPSRRDVLRYGGALGASLIRGQVRAPVRIGSTGGSGPVLLQPADVTYLGYYDLQTNGSNTYYATGFAFRYVSGDFRVLYQQLTGDLHEVSLAGHSYGDVISSATAVHTGITWWSQWNALWWDAVNSKLWTTSAVDYTTTTVPTQIFSCTLQTGGGAIGNAHGPVSLANISAKRVYGGVQAVPSWFQSLYGVAPYVVGWGGYTSLLTAGGTASMGPTMYAMPDLAGFANNASIPLGSSPSADYQVIMDCSAGSSSTDWYAGGVPTSFDRGVRKTNPYNYFDGGGNALACPDVDPTGSSVTISGNTVTWVSGPTNFPCWYAGYSATVGGVTTNYGPFQVGINGTSYTVSSVPNANTLVLTTSPGISSGTITSAPSVVPPFLPIDGGQWLSPAPDGRGRWTWGDTHANTGVWIDTSLKRGFLLFPNLGTGKTYYANSALNFQGRTTEMHIYDPSSLGASVLGSVAPWNVKPTSMTDLSGTLPGLTTQYGGPPTGGGAAFDPATKTLYLMAPGVNSGQRLYVFSVNA